MAEESRRKYEPAARVVDSGIPCPRCGWRYDHRIVNVYTNGNRRRICHRCGRPFLTTRITVQIIAMQ